MKVQLRIRLRRLSGALSAAIIFLFLQSENSQAQSSGDYRAVTTGNWNQTLVWEKYDGSNWVVAIATPTSTDGAITILSGALVTVTANVTVDQLIINGGGFLTINAAKTFTIANGAGVDLTANGTLTINGTLAQNATSTVEISGLIVCSSGASHSINTGAGTTVTIYSSGRYRNDGGTIGTVAAHWIVNSGGTFQSNIDGDDLPYVTWNTGSTCEILGVTSTKPTNLDQTFYNFIWNSTGQTTKEDLGGKLTAINGNFTMTSTGSGSIRLKAGASTVNIGGSVNFNGGTLYVCGSGAAILNVTGNYTQTGGSFIMTDATSSAGAGTPTMSVTGDFIISGGTLDMNQYTSTNASLGIGTINLSGNFNQTGGTLTETATITGHGEFNFAKTGTQTFTKSSGTISNTVNFTVNSGAILDMGTSVVSGGGTFTLSGGGGLIMAEANGITSSGASGNVQVTGPRSFSTTADYTYNGSTAQNTGNGLPSTVHNLTLNNSSDVTLTNSAIVSNVLTFTSGNLTCSSDTLTLGTSTSTLGTLTRTSGHVVGNFRRWIAAAATSNILFPVGTSTDYYGANFSFTIAPSVGGTITCNLTVTPPGKSGFDFFDLPDTLKNIASCYWVSSAANGLTGGTFSLDLTASNLAGVTDYTALHLINRTNGASSWAAQGIHITATGSNTVPVAHRIGLSSYVHFGIASPSANALPIVLIYFNAEYSNSHVDLSWITASEINNSYFTVERSADGIHFIELLKVPGSGNTTSTMYYSAIDDNPFDGISYYRLKQTDFDGASVYSGIVVVKKGSAAFGNNGVVIKNIYPNPFNHSFNIDYTVGSNSYVEIQIINVSGYIVYKKTIHAEKGLNTYSFNSLTECGQRAGIYFVNIVSDGQMVTKEVIKQ